MCGQSPVYHLDTGKRLTKYSEGGNYPYTVYIPVCNNTNSNISFVLNKKEFNKQIELEKKQDLKELKRTGCLSYKIRICKRCLKLLETTKY